MILRVILDAPYAGARIETTMILPPILRQVSDAPYAGARIETNSISEVMEVSPRMPLMRGRELKHKRDDDRIHRRYGCPLCGGEN